MQKLAGKVCLVLAIASGGANTAYALVFPDPGIDQSSRSGSDRQNGLKRALFMVVHDVDDPYTPAEWSTRVNSTLQKELSTRSFYAANSGGKFDIYYEDILDIPIELNDDGTRPSNFWSQAQAIAATTYGKNLSDYFMFAYDLDDTGKSPGQGWGGLSTSNRIYLQSLGQKLIDHEIGHQVGADHAKSYRIRTSAPFHAYTWNETLESYTRLRPGASSEKLPYGVAVMQYGNPFDTMGNQSNGHFRMREKLDDLGWLDESQVGRIDGQGGLGVGTYRIYAHDELVSVTNSAGDFGVAQGYNSNVLYGLTYERQGAVFSTDGGRFIPETQTVDIEYRSGADGAFIYLNNVIVNFDDNQDWILDVGSSTEDIEFGISRFSVEAGSINQDVDDIDFLDFNPPPPPDLPDEWYSISVLGTGADSIGSYIELLIDDRQLPTVLAGDFNLDGVVNAADYVVWRNGLGELYSMDDYELWKQNFGATNRPVPQGVLSAGSVPEPATYTIAAAFLVFAGVISQSSRHRL